MDLEALTASLRWYGQYDYSLSDGPGGQNVQKTASKVRLRIRWEDVGGLSEGERTRAAARLSTRFTKEGELVVAVQDERSQKTNKDLALERMLSLILGAAKAVKQRRATRPTKASAERRLASKKRRGVLKKYRGGEEGEEE